MGQRLQRGPTLKHRWACYAWGVMLEVTNSRESMNVYPGKHEAWTNIETALGECLVFAGMSARIAAEKCNFSQWYTAVDMYS